MAAVSDNGHPQRMTAKAKANLAQTIIMPKQKFLARRLTADKYPNIIKELGGEVIDVSDYRARLKERYPASMGDAAIRNAVRYKYKRELDFF